MKNVLLHILLLLNILYASEYRVVDIRNAAQHYIEQDKLFQRTGQSYSINTVDPLKNEQGEIYVWVAHLSPIGFVLLSADSDLNPVLGFSHDSRFTGHSQTLEMIHSDIQNRKKSVSINKKIQQKNQIRWQKLLSKNKPMHKMTDVQDDSVYYFPTPVWGQGYVNGYAVFNYYTPHNWSTGCVATAMAEALAYYQWPPSGTGSHCYYDNGAQLCADFEATNYDWPNMLDLYQGVTTTSAQRKAAGLLSYHTAISVEMDFESSGSTAETADAPDALHNYFRCSGHYKSVSSDGFWSEMENNMKDARPALLSIKRSDGFGHSVAVDGFYKGKYHLNMGWDGDDNGFYDISGSWNAGGYTIVIGAAKGIVPSPMILPEILPLTEKSYVLSWSVSPKQRAQYFELQQATTSTGPWATLSTTVADTFFQVDVSEVRNYYYRVRARRNDIWWDWSAVQKITMGGPRQITFNVNMKYQTLNPGDSVVIRGNIEPLFGSQNSAALQDSNGDQIYTLKLPFDFDHAGEELNYRFAIAGNSGTNMESFNRTYSIGLEENQNLDTVYFDNYVSIKEGQPILPRSSLLFQNYPNPFNPTTVISYQLSVVGEIRLFIYNALGQKMRTLVNGRQGPGKYSFRFNASALSSGVYYYKLTINGKAQTRKMILLR